MKILANSKHLFVVRYPLVAAADLSVLQINDATRLRDVTEFLEKIKKDPYLIDEPIAELDRVIGFLKTLNPDNSPWDRYQPIKEILQIEPDFFEKMSTPTTKPEKEV